jgi:hypothetical protein
MIRTLFAGLTLLATSSAIAQETKTSLSPQAVPSLQRWFAPQLQAQWNMRYSLR